MFSSRRTGSLALPLLLLPAMVACGAGSVQHAGRTASPTAGLHVLLQAHLDSLHAAGGFPGATAGLAFPDGSTLGLATGWADTARKVRMTPDARLLQGSVGKTYVAAVAMQLVAEGKLDLASPISRYLGSETWFDRLPNAREITVRMLMNHTSGLQRYEFDGQFLRDLARDPYREWTPEARLAYLFDKKPPFAAGAGWDYSDTNYIVLGMIIERLAGRPYYVELKHRVLAPLRLRNTVPADRPRIGRLAQGYAGPDNPFGGNDAMIGPDGRFAFNPQMEWTGGGIASTAEDLARWARLLYEGRAFDPTLLPVMLDGVPAKLGPDARYGLGVILRPTPLGPAYGHSGYFPGYLTEVMYFPEHRIAVAVQFNTSARGAPERSPWRVLLGLARIVVEQTGGGSARPAAGVPPAQERIRGGAVKSRTPARRGMRRETAATGGA